MLWWAFLAFHRAHRRCPPDCQYYYDVETTLLLNETQWHYFWTTILASGQPLRISVWSSGPYALHIGRRSDCPDRTDSVLLKSAKGRSFLATDFFAEGENHAQAFGLYAVNSTTVKLAIKDRFQNKKGLSVPMKLSIPAVAVALGFLGYDFFRGNRRP
jgi:hypothetical protein